MECGCDIDYKLLLEYLKAFISFPFVILFLLTGFTLLYKEDIRELIGKLAKVTLPGGSGFELRGGQAEKTEQEKDQTSSLKLLPTNVAIDLPVELQGDAREYIEGIISSEQLNARRWEYRYLNLYLVPYTQAVLDWLVDYNKPTTLNHLDNVMQPNIDVTEREAILNALSSHHLIRISNDVVTVTGKRREYAAWRGDTRPVEKEVEEVDTEEA